MTRIISNLAEVSGSYKAALVDLWGCVHNGFTPFPGAISALRDFRAQGGVVLLLTNSPRPHPSVKSQLDKIGVPPDAYDAIAASGDASQAALIAGDVGQDVWHLGPARDGGFFDTLPKDVKINRMPLSEASGIVCTGLFDDDTETPEDYRAQLLLAKTKGLKLLCTNPDIIVDKGDKRIFCAGALAALYTEMGGESLYFGKPHPPIYDLARNILTRFGGIEDADILCIGDGINTDIKGAIGEDLDSLFITGGLARRETGTQDQPEPDKLAAFLDAAQLSPTFAIGGLR